MCPPLQLLPRSPISSPDAGDAQAVANAVAGTRAVSLARSETSPQKGARNRFGHSRVALFLAGLVVLGGQQQWWLEPLLRGMDVTKLYFGATTLTAVASTAGATPAGRANPQDTYFGGPA